MTTSTTLALPEKSSETIISPLASDTESSWWRQAAYYVACGLRICRKDIPGLLTLVGLFMLPPLAAVIVGSQPGPLAYWVALGLPWITIVLGNIAAVLAIEALDAGQLVVPARILPAALRWLPRYLWTNGITTVLFWGLFMPLQWVISQQTNRWGWPSFAPVALLLLPMLFWHVRLVFSTYAAIVDDQSGMRAVMISIRLAHRRWKMTVAAFAGSVLIVAPLAGPLYLLILTIHNPVIAGGFEWALLMPMRPLFIATMHMIYKDFRPATALAEGLKQRSWYDLRPLCASIKPLFVPLPFPSKRAFHPSTPCQVWASLGHRMRSGRPAC
jgi:hypothetical protein